MPSLLHQMVLPIYQLLFLPFNSLFFLDFPKGGFVTRFVIKPCNLKEVFKNMLLVSLNLQMFLAFLLDKLLIFLIVFFCLFYQLQILLHQLLLYSQTILLFILLGDITSLNFIIYRYNMLEV